MPCAYDIINVDDFLSAVAALNSVVLYCRRVLEHARTYIYSISFMIYIRFITIGSIFIEKCWLGKFFWRWALSCFELFSITLCLVVFHGDAFFPCHLAFFVHFLFRCVHSMRVGALSCICLCIYFVQMFSCRLPNNKCVFFPMSLSYLLLLLLLPP